MTYKTFWSGIAVCLALMVAIGFGISALNRGHSRPEGVAEDWLTAVGDTAREGVEADSTRRAEEIGPLELADRRLVADNTRGKSAFADLEVGKAQLRSGGGVADVRFQVRARRGESLVEIEGALRLERDADRDWKVTESIILRQGDTPEPLRTPLASSFVGSNTPELASEGGPPPSSASLTLWLIALAGGVAVTAAASGLVHWAGRRPALASAV